MHPWRPWIVLAALATFAGQAAVIYKWTDSDGVIHFSDQPVPGAEKIVTAGGSSTQTSRPAPNAFSTPINLGAPKRPSGLGYTQMSITSPASEQSFFADDPVNLQLTLEPALKPGQSVTWHLNGRDLTEPPPNSTQFTLPRLERGTYAIAATITDPSGQAQSCDSVTFYVRQPSALSPLHLKP
jgi:Domain of unknown function (DUF4124)/Penicillin-Binding Protein C-terminus Family